MSRNAAITTLVLVCTGLLIAGCQRPQTDAPVDPARQGVAAADPTKNADPAGAGQVAPEPEVVPQGTAGPMVTPDTGEPIATFTARGNEPFWSVQVEGDTLTYSTPELQPGRAMQAQRTAHAKGVGFTGQDEGRDFNLDIQDTACEDTMSGEAFEFTAVFQYGDRTLKGCARRGL